MKNILSILLFSLIFTSVGLSQSDIQPQKDPFGTIYVGTGVSFSSESDFTYSVETGMWGKRHPCSYAVVMDVTKNLDLDSHGKTDTDLWVGFKPYYYTLEHEHVSLFLYFSPKFKLPVHKAGFYYLFETGGGVNHYLSDNIALGYGLSVQSSKDIHWLPSLGISLSFIKSPVKVETVKIFN